MIDVGGNIVSVTVCYGTADILSRKTVAYSYTSSPLVYLFAEIVCYTKKLGHFTSRTLIMLNLILLC